MAAHHDQLAGFCKSKIKLDDYIQNKLIKRHDYITPFETLKNFHILIYTVSLTKIIESCIRILFESSQKSGRF